MRRILVLALWLAAWVAPRAAAAASVRLWHAYRGDEERALAEVVASAAEKVELLGVPHDAFAAKLGAAVPLGEGPDLFIDAHERLGDYRELGLVAPAGDALGPAPERDYEPLALAAVSLDGVAYGVPLSPKCLALYYNPALVERPPEHLEDLPRALGAPLPAGGYVLAYETWNAYAHAPLLAGFGGSLLTEGDRFGFVGPEAEASLAFVRGWVQLGLVPAGADGSLVTKLFAAGKAAFVMSGPWLATDLARGSVPYRVTVLPGVRVTGRPMRPLLTVEAVMLTPSGAARPEVRRLAEHLASAAAARVRQRVARTVSARRDAPPPEGDELLQAFAAQARVAVPMPTSAAMRAVFEPSDRAIRKVLSGLVGPREALDEARRRFDDVRRPLPPRRPLAPLVLVLVLGALAAAWLGVRRARAPAMRARLAASLPAYAYILPATVVVALLVALPLLAGALLSLSAGRPGALYYVGLANFVEILTARGGPLLASGSFYLVLAVTALWTVANVALHLGIGVTLGVLLARPALRLRPLYRVLLVVPWAVPSYVTALAWRGMFHRQYGAVNALARELGELVGVTVEPIAWFARFATAFTANLATNVWLGFPFMMVVTLAALTSVPEDVLEAAEVDGASRWQRFWRVTLPIIRPALLPATVLGAVWTFNMFNVVFLVSGGEPDGQTDILVSEAYRWAFTRQAQYGYAAAYAVLIFALLFGLTRLSERRSPARAH
jgi:arabinogalactan oligomer/maltooligosaccharide transport system permease protein